jgi:hypothetical protein
MEAGITETLNRLDEHLRRRRPANFRAYPLLLQLTPRCRAPDWR